ncbi:MAG TPA: glycosyltransferase family 2 protein [Candidatus Gastranaerophilaceae bacterium]|nr:glycosyltransferase family 2 protein [Candidatus Gastranaerophilaceae bacterium]
MSNCSISVIIPVFNSGKYIEKCLESIINQSFEDMEIICINDGSKDNSLEILEKFSDKDSRIKVFSQKNQGLSASRNRGLELASGKYIIFVDSDDWLKKDFAQKLFCEIEKNETDFSICAAQAYDCETLQKSDFMSDYLSLSCLAFFENKVFNQFDTKKQMFYIPVMAWGKIYNRDFLKRTKARFEEVLFFEDNLFFYHIYKHAEKISILKEKLYNYRVNNKNSMFQQSKNIFDVKIETLDKIEETIKSFEYFEQMKNDFLKFKLLHMINILNNTSGLNKIKCYQKLQKKFINVDFKIYDENLFKNTPLYKYYDTIRNKNFIKGLCKLSF